MIFPARLGKVQFPRFPLQQTLSIVSTCSKISNFSEKAMGDFDTCWKSEGVKETEEVKGGKGGKKDGQLSKDWEDWGGHLWDCVQG